MNVTSPTELANVAPSATYNFRVEIYTDGSCHGNPGPSGWAFVAVLFDETGIPIATQERSGSVSSSSTNNRAELEAALNAVAFVKDWPTNPSPTSK